MKTVVVEEPAAVSPWRLVNRVTLGLTVAGFAAAAWDRRWMSDDGLIVLRTVRQLLAGNGPVFNVGERVEANTSTLWTYLLAAFGWVPGVPLEWVAVVTGLLCSAAGLLLALDGAQPAQRRVHPARPVGWSCSRCRRSGTSRRPGSKPA